MPFIKGESGNPAGRPPGSRNRSTLIREAMLDADGDHLTREMIGRAMEGDSTALRLCIDRLLPRGASRPIQFELPRVDSAAASRQAVADILTAMGRGELAPREANEFLRVIDRGAKIIATAEAAEAVAREGQPRRIEVTWVETKEIEAKWKAYWKQRYEALCGPLPELADPEEDGLLPPETAPAAEVAGAPADQDSAPPATGAASVPPAAGVRVARNNNENSENTTPAVHRDGHPAAAGAHRAPRGRSGAAPTRGRRAKRRARARAGGGRLPRGRAASSDE